MCIHPASVAPVTRVLAHSASTYDRTFTWAVNTLLQLLVATARLPLYLSIPPSPMCARVCGARQPHLRLSFFAAGRLTLVKRPFDQGHTKPEDAGIPNTVRRPQWSH
eukprot:COSAG02_NODE_4537_length_5239_cov_3.381712_3_plen_107_part_00